MKEVIITKTKLKGTLYLQFMRSKKGGGLTAVHRRYNDPEISNVITDDHPSKLLSFEHNNYQVSLIDLSYILNKYCFIPRVGLQSGHAWKGASGNPQFFKSLLSIFAKEVIPQFLLSPNDRKRQLAEDFYKNGEQLSFFAYKNGKRKLHIFSFKEWKNEHEN